MKRLSQRGPGYWHLIPLKKRSVNWCFCAYKLKHARIHTFKNKNKTNKQKSKQTNPTPACLMLLGLKPNTFEMLIAGNCLTSCKKIKRTRDQFHWLRWQELLLWLKELTKICLFKLCNSLSHTSNLLKTKCQQNFHSYLHKSKCKSYIHTDIILSLFAFLCPLTDEQELLLFWALQQLKNPDKNKPRVV